MKQKGLCEICFIGVAVGTLCAVAFAFAVLADYTGCSSRWSKAGLEFSYGPFQGCMVKTPRGQWMPESQYISFTVGQ